ncbi:GDP-mannose 4,6-dehydratase [Paenibacillus aceris]|uniref:GDP-4-dehydro-6-deoxy-D-mannose reductase n=1 Tax=Paenibacillus aceris TaxID=869555 RepID=A0ABS4I830_9BACL|nr:GDP-mannose 4,6-dehydratase [Paenibacillus aceris]MBP1966998.1 GDP-4-dehydro-6-deoxy-D-mannose reductase [Paenibacillus aceris]NHW39361.1 NAD-dependent epimerase/dehydratase family protein [Paenibacillus aceris]
MTESPLVLLTGINGFVGQHMAAFLFAQNMNVLGIGRSTSCPLQHAHLQYVSGDLTQVSFVKQLLQDHKVTYIIHLAGVNDVNISYASPAEVIHANAWGTLNILEAVRTCPDKHLRACLAVGTAYEYKLQDEPLTESSQLQPVSPYAWSKQLMSSLMQMYGRVYSIPTVVARTFNLIGPGPAAGVCAQLAKQVARMEKGLIPPKLVIGNMDVQRDFLDVRDAVAAYFSLLQVAAGSPGEIYNVCSGTAYTIRAIVSLLEQYASVPFEVSIQEHLLRRQEASVVLGDAAKLKDASGWEPIIPWQQSILDTLNYYRNL